MRPVRTLFVVLLLGLAGALVLRQGLVSAEPAWGAGCLSCHSVLIEGVVAVAGEDTQADPDESGTGATDRGILPVFQVAPGQTTLLHVGLLGLEADDAYAVELHRLSYPGVVDNGVLTYSPSCDWAYWGVPGKHYTDPAVAYRWGSGPAALSFEITAGAGADEDYYDLVFAVAGKRAAGGDLFYAEQHFYLQVVREPIFSDDFESGDTSHWSTSYTKTLSLRTTGAASPVGVKETGS